MTPPIPKPNIRMGAVPALAKARPASPSQPVPAVHVVLALGSNLGDRAATLRDAVRAVAGIPGFDLQGVSEFVESAAVKPAGVDLEAPRYLNAVLVGRYPHDAHRLLEAVNRIEAEHGRLRTDRWGDRTLDIDIILFGDHTITDDRLTVPHPRAAERDFVLAPWLQLDPGALIPGRGRVSDLLAAVGNTVSRYAGESR